MAVFKCNIPGAFSGAWYKNKWSTKNKTKNIILCTNLPSELRNCHVSTFCLKEKFRNQTPNISYIWSESAGTQICMYSFLFRNSNYDANYCNNMQYQYWKGHHSTYSTSKTHHSHYSLPTKDWGCSPLHLGSLSIILPALCSVIIKLFPVLHFTFNYMWWDYLHQPCLNTCLRRMHKHSVVSGLVSFTCWATKQAHLLLQLAP